MITQQVFSSVIDSQQNSYFTKNTGIEREILKQIPQASGFASIITGLRRCGKSTLLLQVKEKYFKGEGIFLNFDDPRLAGMQKNDWERLYAVVKNRNTNILFQKSRFKHKCTPRLAMDY